MGEQAEYMLNGDDCESCGVHIGDGPGYPRKCDDCKSDDVPQTGILEFEAIKILSNKGFHVKQFSDHHFRINGKVDVWPSKNKYHVLGTDKRGKYRAIEEIIEDYLKKTKPENASRPDNSLTLRRRYAMAAMQGMLAGAEELVDPKDLAKHSFRAADAMIEFEVKENE